MHAYHEGLESFNERQIWYDGCEECENRSQNLPYSLGQLDNDNLRKAIQRTKDWKYGYYDSISQAELPLLRLLETFLLVQERLDKENF